MNMVTGIICVRLIIKKNGNIPLDVNYLRGSLVEWREEVGLEFENSI